MQFTQERSEEGGVTRRLFELTVDGAQVPAAIWAPEGAKGPRPLVLMGHGGSQHKKTPGIVARARAYARKWAATRPWPSTRQAMATASRARRRRNSRAMSAPGFAVRPRRPWTPSACVSSDNAACARFPNGRRRSMRSRRWTSSAPADRSVTGVSPWARRSACPSSLQEPRITVAIFGLAGLRPGARPSSRRQPSGSPFRCNSSSNGRKPWRRERPASRSSTPSVQLRKQHHAHQSGRASGHPGVRTDRLGVVLCSRAISKASPPTRRAEASGPSWRRPRRAARCGRAVWIEQMDARGLGRKVHQRVAGLGVQALAKHADHRD